MSKSSEKRVKGQVTQEAREGEPGDKLHDSGKFSRRGINTLLLSDLLKMRKIKLFFMTKLGLMINPLCFPGGGSNSDRWGGEGGKRKRKKEER